jgi:hypothetical protein
MTFVVEIYPKQELMKNLYIPNPCSESWEAMSPQDQGKFCSVCSKCVIDFTEKQPQEIQQIFQEQENEAICGRFYHSQLNKESKKSLDDKVSRYIPTALRNNKISLAIVAMILFLTGCSKSKDVYPVTTDDVLIEKDSVQSNDSFVMGEPLIQNDSVAQMHQKDSLKLKHQK